MQHQCATNYKLHYSRYDWSWSNAPSNTNYLLFNTTYILPEATATNWNSVDMFVLSRLVASGIYMPLF